MTSTSPTIRVNAWLALVLALLAIVVPAPARATDDNTPTALVEQTTSRVLAILADHALSADEKRHRIEDVVYDSVDFETLSRLVLARNWSRFNDDQRVAFMDAFKQHLSMTYGRNVESYHNEKVTILSSRAESQGDWTVKTKILRGGPGDISVDYRARQRDGRWRIIDVIIEGVSLVSNFRSQFQDVVSNGGPDHLITLLREKNAKGEPLKTS